MKKIIFSIFTVSFLIFTSCSDDDGNGSTSIETPDDYTFSRSEATSVSFSGQTTRIAMGAEFVDALLVETNTVVTLEGMFAHVEGANDFSDADLNASDKSIRSKVAASEDFFSANTTDATAIKGEFDAWISGQVSDVFPNFSTIAESGVAGVLAELGGSDRYINSKGVELNQVINKGLIGGLMVDQILNNYLSPSVLDAGDNIANNDNDVLDGDNNYTSMEHKWDEAFGYLYGAEEDITSPVLNIDDFLNKYLSRVEGDSDFAGIADDIYDAFVLGRAAIVAKDYDVRDEQAEIIREKISEVIGVRAVYYLQAGKTLLETIPLDYAAAFHDLSEGLGFVYSLQFTRKPNSSESYFTKAEVDGYLSDLLDSGNGLWEPTTAATLETISTAIAAKFDFSLEEASTVD